MTAAPPCWHKRIGEDGICLDCGKRAAISLMLPPAEILGNQVALQLKDLDKRLKAAQQVATALLKHVSTPGNCKGCGVPIRWVRHISTGKITPYDLDGVNHFVTCSDRERFRKLKEEQNAG
jgi:hypothetical protein